MRREKLEVRSEKWRSWKGEVEVECEGSWGTRIWDLLRKSLGCGVFLGGVGW